MSQQRQLLSKTALNVHQVESYCRALWLSAPPLHLHGPCVRVVPGGQETQSRFDPMRVTNEQKIHKSRLKLERFALTAGWRGSVSFDAHQLYNSKGKKDSSAKERGLTHASHRIRMSVSTKRRQLRLWYTLSNVYAVPNCLSPTP